ncbi:MAG: ATP-sensitive inward rectifier potassium channel 10 [Alphaproteobacteria bacterium]|nr:ATP-sensitive inward rectifier potassium channel 10 [Alphaproteobacteria bacterium]MBV9063792.1 ATP-sensitive inward rectifier potassium channel 10 [Alphaproteobacteria bacterium]
MNKRDTPPGRPPPGISTAQYLRNRKLQRVVIRGQDKSRWTDFYHAVLTAPWWMFLLGLAAAFFGINVIFALIYLTDPGGIEHARPGSFWDRFLFSAQTIGSINYSVMVPKSAFVNTMVVFEAFVGFVYLAMIASLMFARLSRPSARVMFSRVAVVAPFDGVPTLMFRAANQRGNQILDAAITVTLAYQALTQEGIPMRRFQELKLLRARTSLFTLSWTVMHRIDSTSPLHSCSLEEFRDRQMELIVLLRGTDDTLADTVYVRHAYTPEEILWNHRFADVLSVNAHGRRVVDLTRFHDTSPIV